MKRKYFILIVALALVLSACSSAGGIIEEDYDLTVEGGSIYGTLTLPEGEGPFKVAIIHPGSGPTDRDGNSAIAGSNNGLKMIAQDLANNGIASIRYDKRGIAESMGLIKSESELVFEDYINDLILWIDKAKSDGRFTEIYLIGHSEGALISAAAAVKSQVAGFISLAGVGEPAYDTLIRQLSAQPKEITELTTPIIMELKEGRTVADVPEMLQSLFRDSVQPYLISWFKYDPVVVYSEIKSPIIIIQGDTDIQVTVEDARMLGEGTGIEPIIISGMNHILKEAPADPEENLKTYQDPKLPLHQELMGEIISFINNN